MHVSNKYLRSCVLLSLTSVAGRTSCVCLAYVISCLNKAWPDINSILYAFTILLCASGTIDLYYAVEFISVVEGLIMWPAIFVH